MVTSTTNATIADRAELAQFADEVLEAGEQPAQRRPEPGAAATDCSSVTSQRVRHR